MYKFQCFRHISNDSSVCSSDSVTRDLRLIRKRKLEEETLQSNGGEKKAKLVGSGGSEADIQLHQSPTKLLRPLLPLANPNVLEEEKPLVQPLVRPQYTVCA